MRVRCQRQYPAVGGIHRRIDEDHLTKGARFALARLCREGAIPELPVHVDSPMALEVLRVYRDAIRHGDPELRTGARNGLRRPRRGVGRRHPLRSPRRRTRLDSGRAHAGGTGPTRLITDADCDGQPWRAATRRAAPTRAAADRT